MVETQIGPPPPIHATPGMHLQYHLLRRTRLKSHVIDTLSSLIESLAMAIVKMLFCYLVDLNLLDGSVSLKMIFMPFWWVCLRWVGAGVGWGGGLVGVSGALQVLFASLPGSAALWSLRRLASGAGGLDEEAAGMGRQAGAVRAPDTSPRCRPPAC